MNDGGFRRIFPVVLLLLTVGSPACAAAAQQPHMAVRAGSASAAIVLADGWNVGKFVSGGGRTRVVQVCVVVMCIALFIMMRKLN